MNSLCEAIMNDIDSIDISCADAQFAVVEASVALEEKFIEMTAISDRNGFIQESKMEDFFAKADAKLDHKPNEKLIKTILLAIPRLLLNLLKIVYNKWHEMSFNNRCRRVETELRELKEYLNQLDSIDDTMGAIARNPAPEGFRLQANPEGGAIIYITIYVSNIDKLREAYDKMRDVCIDYADAIENGVDKLAGDYVDMTSINAEIRSSLKRNEIHETGPFIESPPDEYNKVVEFRQYHEKIMNEIKQAVTKLEKWVTSHLQFNADSKGGITKDTAKKLLADARKLYTDFLKNDSMVLAAIDKTITAYANGISWYFAQVQQIGELQKQRAGVADNAKAKIEEIQNKDKDLNYAGGIDLIDIWDNPNANKK